MFSYQDGNYKEIAKQCNYYVNLEYGENNNSNDKGVLFEKDGSILLKNVVLSAWNEFYRMFSDNAYELDEKTKFNREDMDIECEFSIDSFKSDERITLFNIFRVLYEVYFWRGATKNIPPCLRVNVFEKLNDYYYKNQSGYNGEFLWIERAMPAKIFMWLIRTKEIATLNETIGHIDEFEKKINKEINELDNNFSSRELNLNDKLKNIDEVINTINGMENKLKGYKTEYNFVLLSKAFTKIKKVKNWELFFAHFRTVVFMLLLIAVPIGLYLFHKPIIKFSLNDIFIYGPAVTLEILFFYFMRLFYTELRSIRAQLLQIQLRLSLCEFIHDYVDKRAENKDAEEAWKAFETLIFSPIQTSGDNIPSLLDGANAIAELAGKIMRPGVDKK